jgi:carboxylesterase type B
MSGGTNNLVDSKEGTWFTLDEFGNDPGSVTADNYTKFLKDNFGSAASSIEKVYSFSAYENEEYPGWSAIVDTITDASFRCSAYRALNRAVEKNIPVWTYLFTHTPSCTWLSGINDDELSVLGATHTAELPYSFGMMDNSVLTGGSCNSTDAEYAISNFMIQAWTSMAAIGRPSSDNASWPEYNNASSPSIIFTNSTGLGAINYTTCAVWDPVDQDFLPSSTTTSASSTSTVKPSSATSSKGASTRITVAVEGWFITGLIIGLTPFL